MSLFIPSPNFYTGRKADLKWIVLHTTESPEKTSAAYNIARNWFGLASAGVSAHVVVDDGRDSRYPDGIIECVKPGDTAWHCANGNASGYGVEIVGYASQGAAQWSDDFSLRSIRNAMNWVTSFAATRDIPEKWLTDLQLRNGEKGFITHAQVSRVLGGTSHTDPGVNFPFQYAMGGSPSNRLKYGLRNDPGVREFQAFLNNAFKWHDPLPITGNYLDLTRAVLKEFQYRVGAKGDGSIVDPATVIQLRRFGYPA